MDPLHKSDKNSTFQIKIKVFKSGLIEIYYKIKVVALELKIFYTKFGSWSIDGREIAQFSIMSKMLVECSKCHVEKFLSNKNVSFIK